MAKYVACIRKPSKVEIRKERALLELCSDCHVQDPQLNDNEAGVPGRAARNALVLAAACELLPRRPQVFPCAIQSKPVQIHIPLRPA